MIIEDTCVCEYIPRNGTRETGQLGTNRSKSVHVALHCLQLSKMSIFFVVVCVRSTCYRCYVWCC